MKGFFDTIPKDLDESAKVDGATHAQIFFGIILPLVAPILAVTGLLGFIGAMNEFMIASIFLTEDSAKTAAVGLYGLVSEERNNNFGVFAAGALLLAIPTSSCSSSCSATSSAASPPAPSRGSRGRPPLDEPHHDGSELYVPEQAPDPGDTVPVFVRVPHGDGATGVWVRTTPDAEPHFAPGRIDRSTPWETWWRCDVDMRNPLTNYRFLLDGGPGGYRWLNGTGPHPYDVTDAEDFRISTYPPPGWAGDAIVYQIFPDRSPARRRRTPGRCPGGPDRPGGTMRSSSRVRRPRCSCSAATWTGSSSTWTTSPRSVPTRST